MEKVIKLNDSQVGLMQGAIRAREQGQENMNLIAQAFVAGSKYRELEGGFNFDAAAKTLTLTIPDDPEEPEDV